MEKFISQFTFRSTVVPPKLAWNSEANQKKKKKKENFIAGQKECRRVVARVNLCDEVVTRLSFNPFDTYEWQASNFSLQYLPKITG